MARINTHIHLSICPSAPAGHSQSTEEWIFLFSHAEPFEQISKHSQRVLHVLPCVLHTAPSSDDLLLPAVLSVSAEQRHIVWQRITFTDTSVQFTLSSQPRCFCRLLIANKSQHETKACLRDMLWDFICSHHVCKHMKQKKPFSS